MYGHLFLYRTRTVDRSLGPMPDFLHDLLARLDEVLATSPFTSSTTTTTTDTTNTSTTTHTTTNTEQPMNLLVVNEYQRGQGIMPHADASLFGEVIAALSLLSSSIMTFECMAEVEAEANNMDMRPVQVLLGTYR